MTLTLTIRGEFVEEIQVVFDGCLSLRKREHRTQEYADYSRRKYWRDLMIANNWQITLSVYSQARPADVTNEEMNELSKLIEQKREENSHNNHD